MSSHSKTQGSRKDDNTADNTDNRYCSSPHKLRTKAAEEFYLRFDNAEERKERHAQRELLGCVVDDDSTPKAVIGVQDDYDSMILALDADKKYITMLICLASKPYKLEPITNKWYPPPSRQYGTETHASNAAPDEQTSSYQHQKADIRALKTLEMALDANSNYLKMLKAKPMAVKRISTGTWNPPPTDRRCNTNTDGSTSLFNSLLDNSSLSSLNLSGTGLVTPDITEAKTLCRPTIKRTPNLHLKLSTKLLDCMPIRSIMRTLTTTMLLSIDLASTPTFRYELNRQLSTLFQPVTVLTKLCLENLSVYKEFLQTHLKSITNVNASNVEESVVSKPHGLAELTVFEALEENENDRKLEPGTTETLDPLPTNRRTNTYTNDRCETKCCCGMFTMWRRLCRSINKSTRRRVTVWLSKK